MYVQRYSRRSKHRYRSRTQSQLMIKNRKTKNNLVIQNKSKSLKRMMMKPALKIMTLMTRLISKVMIRMITEQQTMKRSLNSKQTITKLQMVLLKSKEYYYIYAHILNYTVYHSKSN